MVGVSKSCLGGGAEPSAARTRETIWMLRIESPPRSKKLSSTPTRAASTPSTSAQIAASRRSAASRGAAYAVPVSAPLPGSGSARRFSVPLGLSGSASRVTNPDGTACPGRTPPRNVFSSRASTGSPSDTT